MFLGYVQLDAVFSRLLLAKSAGLPVEPDAAPAYSIYNDDDQAFITGFLTGEIDEKTGLYKVTFTASTGNGFSRGTYSMVVEYEVDDVVHRDAYVFTVT